MLDWTIVESVLACMVADDQLYDLVKRVGAARAAQAAIEGTFALGEFVPAATILEWVRADLLNASRIRKRRGLADAAIEGRCPISRH